MFVNRIQRLSEVLHFGPGRQATTVDADKTYAYDAAGRRVSKNDECYRYNPRGELILALSFQGELRR